MIERDMIKILSEIAKTINTLFNMPQLSRLITLCNEKISVSIKLLKNTKGPANVCYHIPVLSLAYICANDLAEILGESSNKNLVKTARQIQKMLNNFKKTLLEYTCMQSNTSNQFLKNIVSSIIRKKIETIKQVLKAENLRIIEISARSLTKTFIGSSDLYMNTVYGVSIQLKTIYGIPYIPSSSIKGALRHYISEMEGDTKTVSEQIITLDELMGSDSSKGIIIVCDAYPDPDFLRESNKYLLCPEVTTPIYADGTPSPRVEEDKAVPVPIIYPVICKNIRFRLIFGIGNLRDKTSNRIYQYFKSWIKESLLHGIGGKTRLGYGIVLGVPYD